MKILLAHTFYVTSSPSGEDVVYRNERQLLEQSGHQVVAFERSNDSISTSLSAKLRTAVGATWSRETSRDLKAVIERERVRADTFQQLVV